MELDPFQIQIGNYTVVAGIWVNESERRGEFVEDGCLVGFDVLGYFEGIHSLEFFCGGADEGTDELVGFYSEDVVRELCWDVRV